MYNRHHNLGGIAQSYDILFCLEIIKLYMADSS